MGDELHPHSALMIPDPIDEDIKAVNEKFSQTVPEYQTVGQLASIGAANVRLRDYTDGSTSPEETTRFGGSCSIGLSQRPETCG